MKKLTILIGSLLVLSACSSPPKATPFPDDSNAQNVDTFIFSNRTPKVPLNNQDKGNWHYSFINHGRYIHQANATKFWYLAHHATKITLQGEKDNIYTLKLNLIARGATADFILEANCENTRKRKCPPIVNMIFERVIQPNN